MHASLHERRIKFALNRYKSELYNKDNISLSLVKRAIRKGVDLKITPYDGVTPLMLAAYRGDCKLIRFLLGYGIDVNARDKQGANAAIYAGRSFSLTAASLLKSVNCDFTVIDVSGMCGDCYFKNIDI